MKLGYFGTPEHSAKLLKALIDSDLAEVLFVVTNPDRPKGRSKTPEAGPVKKIALEHRLPVFQYESIKKERKSPFRFRFFSGRSLCGFCLRFHSSERSV